MVKRSRSKTCTFSSFLAKFSDAYKKMRRKSADSANAIVDWMVEAIAIQKSVGGDFVLDHPEDLGAHPSEGTLGSIWRWATVSALLDDHARYGAFCQGDYGASSAKPSRMTSMATVATLLETGPRRTFHSRPKMVVQAGNIVVLDVKNPHIRNIRDGTVFKLHVNNVVYTMDMWICLQAAFDEPVRPAALCRGVTAENRKSRTKRRDRIEWS